MKWFKHLSHSLDDQFICELMDEFGSDGYLAFFGTLEILASEYNVEFPGEMTVSWRFYRRKLRLSPQKIKKVLDFCEKKHVFIVNNNEREVTVKNIKFSEYCDEYTQRLIKKDTGSNIGRMSGQHRDSVGSLSVPIKKEKKKENKDIQTSFVFPLRDGEYELGKDKILEYQNTYQNIDIIQALKECLQWNRDNEAKRKTRRGILRHINKWLKGASQDKGYIAKAPDMPEHERDMRTPEQKKADMAKLKGFMDGVKLKGMT